MTSPIILTVRPENCLTGTGLIQNGLTYIILNGTGLIKNGLTNISSAKNNNILFNIFAGAEKLRSYPLFYIF